LLGHFRIHDFPALCIGSVLVIRDRIIVHLLHLALIGIVRTRVVLQRRSQTHDGILSVARIVLQIRLLVLDLLVLGVGIQQLQAEVLGRLDGSAMCFGCGTRNTEGRFALKIEHSLLLHALFTRHMDALQKGRLLLGRNVQGDYPRFDFLLHLHLVILHILLLNTLKGIRHFGIVTLETFDMFKKFGQCIRVGSINRCFEDFRCAQGVLLICLVVMLLVVSVVLLVAIVVLLVSSVVLLVAIVVLLVAIVALLVAIVVLLIYNVVLLVVVIDIIFVSSV